MRITPNSGEFFQLEVLRAIGAVPVDFRKDDKPKKYPVKNIDMIIRIKKAPLTVLNGLKADRHANSF
jgi:hypothetical protein